MYGYVIIFTFTAPPYKSVDVLPAVVVGFGTALVELSLIWMALVGISSTLVATWMSFV
jgi:hypothetical protein